MKFFEFHTVAGCGLWVGKLCFPAWVEPLMNLGGFAMVRRFEDLRVWQESMDLVDEVFEVSGGFPKSEIYGLTSQIRSSTDMTLVSPSAAVSVVSNISEGCGCATDKGFVHYLHNSLGNVKEVKCQLMVVVRLKFLSEEESEKVIAMADKVAGMLMRFIKHVCGGSKDEA